ncbi:hypothetical protein ASE14_00210 [Agromyces sp. Root81]|uniref:hypothetical protein n=1 Tax=Agromyces sp. Root81 TaxID=1736601 RepID=UPI0006F4841D|nr:hypothetical protein [Agromyces sp. Root81]KRC62316.1 hypothetical protein ASE14_00210 [Agromyces sp. Root81]
MRLKLVGILALLALLTGCSVSPGSPSGASPEQQGATEEVTISAEQKAALDDGEVTQDEYEAGYRRFVDCLSAAGFEILDNGIENDIHQFGIPEAAVASGDDARCYGAEYEQVDIKWQIAHEDTSKTAKIIADCLTAAGVTPKSSMAELQTQLEENGLTFEQCAKQGG